MSQGATGQATSGEASGNHSRERSGGRELYIDAFRGELDAMTHAAGYEHPGQFTPHDVEVSAGPGIFRSLYELYGYDKKMFAPGRPPEFKRRDRTGSPLAVR